MTRRTVARALVYLSLTAATLVVLLPLAVVLLTSLKTPARWRTAAGRSPCPTTR